MMKYLGVSTPLVSSQVGGVLAVQDVIMFSDEENLEIVQALIDYQEEKGYQKGWVYYQLKDLPELELSLGDWREIARRLGYKAGWGWYKWKEMQVEYSSGAA